MKKTLGIFALMISIVFLVGCSSRTQANIGPLHFGGDVKAHENWNLSFTFGAERTEIGLGFVTVGVDGKIGECTQAIAVSHKTEITQAGSDG